LKPDRRRFSRRRVSYGTISRTLIIKGATDELGYSEG
jgi:hypothetical protein